MRLTRIRRVSAIDACVTLLTLCLAYTRGGAIWIEKGSDASHLVFGLAKDERGGHSPPPLDGFSVARYSCRGTQGDAKLIWNFGPERPHRDISRDLSVVSRVVYGAVPKGYKVDHVASPMTPGCYIASFGADGYYASMEFVITADGAALTLR